MAWTAIFTTFCPFIRSFSIFCHLCYYYISIILFTFWMMTVECIALILRDAFGRFLMPIVCVLASLIFLHPSFICRVVIAGSYSLTLSLSQRDLAPSIFTFVFISQSCWFGIIQCHTQYVRFRSEMHNNANITYTAYWDISDNRCIRLWLYVLCIFSVISVAIVRTNEHTLTTHSL